MANNIEEKAKIIGDDKQTVETFLTLEDVLGMDGDKLTALYQSSFTTEKLGAIPWTAIEHPEYKQAKKDCMSMTIENGNVNTTVDDDKLMVKIVLLAVDKDTRSNFTFANKALIEKLDKERKAVGKSPVITADDALSALLLPGEIVNFAVAIQEGSGFSQKKAKKDADAIKNS